MAGQRILVIGGAGYIGSHVAKAFRDAGDTPVVFDNMSTGRRENLLDGFEFIEGDILELEQVTEALRGIDAVIHLAALKAAGDSMKTPEIYATNNIVGTINILNAMLKVGVKTIVFSSSAAVYGEPQYSPMCEEHPTSPVNFYGHTKLEIERLMGWYARLRGLRYVSLRYFNAAGYDVDGEITGLEKNPANLLPVVLEVIMGKRAQVEVFGDDYDTPDGTCVRDYVHVTDLAQGHVQALSRVQAGGDNLVLNLGTSNGLSVLEVLETAKRCSGNDFRVKMGPRRAGDPAIVLATAKKAHEVLGWQPKHSDVQTIVQTMLNAYRANS